MRTTSFVPAAQATPPLAASAPSIGRFVDTRAIRGLRRCA
jgi:hypothetical protein